MLYSRIPNSVWALIERVPILVIPSVRLLPLSVTSVTVGVVIVVSRVKVRLLALLVLPAISVCCTRTVLAPSDAMKPGVQVTPLSMLYSTAAPGSTPVTLSAPMFVIASGLLLPLSVTSAATGIAMFVSSVKVRLLALLELPAMSVWRTRTALAPSDAANPVVQVTPLSILYSMTAPGSIPVTLSEPMLVILSVLLLPLSVSSATVGAVGGVVSRVKVSPLPPLELPATSVWRTITVLEPSIAVKLEFHDVPPSMLY